MPRARIQLALTIVLCGVSTAQSVFDRNLIVNPGAEAGSAINQPDDARVEVPNWTTTGTMTVANYNVDYFLEPGSYGARNRGSKYFVARAEPDSSTATQTINLAAGAAEIDAGRVRFHLGAYIGGAFSVRGGLRAIFLDAAGRTLLDVTAAAPQEDEFRGNGGLLLRTLTGFILPNTRSVRLVLELRALDSGFGWPGADELSLVLKLEPVIGNNLVVNGDAETDDGETNQNTWSPITGWNTVPYVLAVKYVGTSFQSSDPLPENRGRNLFAVYETSTLSIFQTFDVTLAKDRIDSGGVGYALSGYLGGLWEAPDKVKLTVVFFDAGGQEISRSEVGPVSVEERGGKSGLLKRTGEGPVPAGTRQARITLTFAHEGDAFADNLAYADNISFFLTSVVSNVDLTRIANSASNATGAIAPGEMVTLSTAGVTLDSVVRMQLDTNGRVKTELGGVKVFFDGTQAPLLFVNSSQIGAVVPFDTDGKSTTQVRVEYQGVKSNTVSANITRSAPGVFTQEGTATGRGLIYSDTWVLNSTANPAAKGGLVTIIWTGGGQMNPRGVDGAMEGQTLSRVASPVTVTIGGQSAEVVYAGGVPFSWAGLLMVQAKVPAAAATGDALPVIVSVGGAASQAGVTMAVR